jgi:hypothetical protein
MTDRRSFIKTAGAATVTAAIAGCTGEASNGTTTSTTGSTDATSTKTTAGEQEAGDVFDVNVQVDEQRVGDTVGVKSYALFQTAESVGLQFAVANESGGPLSQITVHIELLTAKSEVFADFETQLVNAALKSLEADEEWHGDVVFEGLGADELVDSVDSIQVWATGRSRSK